MGKTVNTYISKSLYLEILRELKKLKIKESKKRKNKKRITRYDACESLARKLIR